MIAIVGWIAVATTAFHLATANIWGYHRDEFYYLACGRRLAWGFVDHPPLTPALYRLAASTVGTSKFGLRITPALFHGGTVILVVCLARELGGSTRAQLLAALATALAPLLLTTGHFLGTVTVEITAGAALALVLVKLVNGADPRWWIVVGIACGIGLLNKWTFAFAIVGLALGLLLLDRHTLATPWVLAGGVVAAVIVAPNVWWQAQHGWPQLEFAQTLRDYGQSATTIPAQLLLLGAGAVLAVPGIAWLLRDPAGRPYRFLVVAGALALVLVLVTGGKPYYTAAILPAFVAVGACALGNGRGWVLPAVVVGGGLLLAPLALPLLPVTAANAVSVVNPELGEMLGWEALAHRVATLHARHPDAGILTENYSEAGAVELLEPGLPQPASGHNSYWDWGPPAGSPPEVIAIGRNRAKLDAAFAHVERIATVATPDGAHNREDGTPIWLARDPRGSWPEIWPGLRRV